MVEKDELVARTKEEMIYFKRELLNREENFNSKFSRQPTVGVMQVIKPKEEKEAGKGVGFGGKTSIKPQYTVPSGGGSRGSLDLSAGTGTGMGIGIGGAGMGMGMSMSASERSVGAQGAMPGKAGAALPPGKGPGPPAHAKGLL